MRKTNILTLQIVLFIILLMLLNSCAFKKNNNISADIIFELCEQTDSTKFEFKIIKLETKKEALLHSIAQVEIFQDYIFVLDNIQSRKLLVFNKNGEFISQIGRPGKGPSEYTYPWSFGINEDKANIVILDVAQNKMLVYDLYTFEPISEIQLDFSATKFVFLEDGNIVWNGPHTDSHILVTDEKGTIIKTYLPRIFNPNVIIGNATENLYIIEDEIFFNPPFSSDIYSINTDSTFCKFNISLDKHKTISESELKNFNINNRDYIDYMTNSKKAHLFNYYNTTDFIYSKFVIDKTLFIGIYDKQNNKANYISKNNFISSLALPDFYNPVGTYNEWIISVINNFDVLDKLELNHFFNPQIKGSLEQINENSGFYLLLLRHI